MMYQVERTDDELIVYGPDGYCERLAKSAVGIVHRIIDESGAQPCTTSCGQMSDAEVVACALGIPSYDCR